MSKVGLVPITIDESKVKVSITDGGDYHHQVIEVSGDKGTLKQSVRKGVVVKYENGVVTVDRKSETKSAKAYHGLYRSLIANMVKGVTEGYVKKLEIHGTGYRGELKSPGTLELKLGFSHPVSYKAPEGIDLQIVDQTQIIVTGFDKQLVGQVASEIRALREPEPYKGKGIRYENEQIKRKAGKTASAG